MLAGLSINRVCLLTHDLPNSFICIIFDNGMNKTMDQPARVNHQPPPYHGGWMASAQESTVLCRDPVP